jgi:hypothetical protein
MMFQPRQQQFDLANDDYEKTGTSSDPGIEVKMELSPCRPPGDNFLFVLQNPSISLNP